MIVKVKEPQPAECALLRAGPDALHLPAPRARPGADQGADRASGATAIAYETVTSARGGLPLLAPMSEVAGRMSIQAGAHCLEKEQGGRGMLLGGVPGVRAGQGGRPRRRRRRHQRGAHGDRAGGAGHRARHQRRRGCTQLDQQFGASVNTIYSTRAGDRGLRARRRSRDRRGAGAGRRGAEALTREAGQGHEARLGARRRRHRPGRLLGDLAADHARATRPTSSTASCTTASPTCRAPWRAPPPSRSTTRRCPSRWRWPTRAPKRRCSTTRTCSRASTSTRGNITHPAVADALGLPLADPRKLLAG